MLKVAITSLLALALATTVLADVLSENAEGATKEAASRVLVKRYIVDYGLVVQIWWDEDDAGFELSTGENRCKVYLTLMSTYADPSGQTINKYGKNTYWGFSLEKVPAPVVASEVIVYTEEYESGPSVFVVGFADERYRLPKVGVK